MLFRTQCTQTMAHIYEFMWTWNPATLCFLLAFSMCLHHRHNSAAIQEQISAIISSRGLKMRRVGLRPLVNHWHRPTGWRVTRILRYHAVFTAGWTWTLDWQKFWAVLRMNNFMGYGHIVTLSLSCKCNPSICHALCSITSQKHTKLHKTRASELEQWAAKCK